MTIKYLKMTTAAVLVVLVASISGADEKAGADKTKKELEVKLVKEGSIARIEARGTSGYHCNTLYPWKLTVSGPEKQTSTYDKKQAKEFSKERVVFEVPLVKGQKAKLKMSVCNDTQCIMHTEELSW